MDASNVLLLFIMIPEVDLINFRDRQSGETGSGSGLPDQPFPDPASPNQASLTWFPLAVFPNPEWQCR